MPQPTINLERMQRRLDAPTTPSLGGTPVWWHDPPRACRDGCWRGGGLRVTLAGDDQATSRTSNQE